MILLDGKKVSEELDKEYNKQIEFLKEKKIIPFLSVILVGDRPDSLSYVKMKKKKCDKLGIAILIIKMDKKVNNNDIIQQINIFNKDKNIHGIIVQLPLPEHINKDLVLDKIDVNKDVDGFHYNNIGRLTLNKEILFKPCTPEGCLILLEKYNIDLFGKDIVVIGKSNIVGLPLSIMLMHKEATVTVCHINTKNIEEKVRNADILFVACGVPKLVKKEWLKQNVVIVDIGINKIEDQTKKSGYKLVGDVDFDECKEIASYITPVPNGIGPMTVSILIKHTILSCFKINKLDNIKLK